MARNEGAKVLGFPEELSSLMGPDITSVRQLLE